MDICPCKKCYDRHAECHAGCSAYAQWKKGVVDIREERYKDKRLDDFFTKPRYRGRRSVKR